MTPAKMILLGGPISNRQSVRDQPLLAQRLQPNLGTRGVALPNTPRIAYLSFPVYACGTRFADPLYMSDINGWNGKKLGRSSAGV
jgi:hypothetical protein